MHCEHESKKRGVYKRKIHPFLCALAHQERLIHNPIPPFEIFIEISAFCNLRCSTCPQSGGLNRPKGHMSIDLFKEVIEQAHYWASQVSLFLAGEPLLYPHLSRALQIASEAGLYTRIHTNGLLLDEEKIDILLSGFLDELSISLDGPNREHYEKIRVGGDFERCLTKVKELMEVRFHRGLTKPRLIVQSLCLKGENEQKIWKGNEELLKGYNYEEIHVIPSHSFGGFYKEHLRYSDSNKRKYNACAMLYNRMTVLWDGRTTACCNDFMAKYITGNVNKSSLQEIWNGEPYKVLRTILRDRQYEQIELCSKCDVLWSGQTSRKVPFARFGLYPIGWVSQKVGRFRRL